MSFCTSGLLSRTEARKAMLMQIVPISGWMKNHIQVPVQNATIARTVIANAARYMVAGTLTRLTSRQATPR
ncbi:hypothetical protein BKM31_35205 [[Actinomadura] parvosata subsp. kistnae]|uniref:Uncharacterized protein n=1 Tax=[Actinomadura] parvosata subsp. kistnae TaxID=1909395 RepID=A0A1V0A781_9ACTN|nr:hypothetical protein BKM31_35205 [Nonomuraea sp. ATCC 55076]